MDQIAAGEVVERPAHMIKELIENSLDAGATEITVEVALGGRSVIISDNGAGILPEDMSRALDRHATSKIRETEDIWKLHSYGFRGEALASIAAVSRLTLSSRVSSQESGSRLLSSFGERSEVDQIQHGRGTQIRIDDLFENVPARLKFLKSSAAEISQIKSVLKALALANPQVTLKVLLEAQLLYFWPKCESRLERVKQVLELSEVFDGEATREGVQAYSVFADPHQVAKTSKQIWIFVQNRWVQDRALQAAVMEAYRNLLMHGEFPYCVVWVSLDPKEVDVNIHPNKSQVKFVNSSAAFRAVQASIRESLETAPWLGKAEESQTQAQTPAQSMTFFAPELERTQYATRAAYQAVANEVRERRQEQVIETRNDREDRALYWSKLQVLTQANLTYILAQGAEGLVLVDQHAAHERYLFEKILASYREGKFEIQEYLFPLAIDLSPEKIEAVLSQSESLKRLGIEVESLGPAVLGIKAASSLFKESAIIKWLEPFAQAVMDQGDSFLIENKLNDLIASMACHSAIRAGDPLSLEQMQSLLQSLDEYPLTSFCPHGRPVSVKYGWSELDRDFGRLV